jgi:hypothetical protein
MPEKTCFRAYGMASFRITSGLLATVDAVRQMLAEIKTTEQDGKEEYASLIENLTRFAATSRR